MSQDNVQKALERLGGDAAFRAAMIKDTIATLKKEFPSGGLTDAEMDSFKKLVAGVAADAKGPPRPWWQPSSFKELGGGFLSLVLVGLLLWVVAATFAMMRVLPQGVTIGNTVQVVDTYDRVKDLLATLLPLFGAVVTFWLGVAIEGKRADQNKDAADKAGDAADSAKESEKKAKATAAAKLGEAKGQAKALSLTNRTSFKAMAGAPSDLDARLDSLIQSLEEGEKAVLG